MRIAACCNNWFIVRKTVEISSEGRFHNDCRPWRELGGSETVLASVLVELRKLGTARVAIGMHCVVRLVLTCLASYPGFFWNKHTKNRGQHKRAWQTLNIEVVQTVKTPSLSFILLYPLRSHSKHT